MVKEMGFIVIAKNVNGINYYAENTVK